MTMRIFLDADGLQLRHPPPRARNRAKNMNMTCRLPIRRIATTLCMSILAFAQPVSLYAQSSQEKAVLAPIRALFDGMSKRDSIAIKAPTLAGGAMVLMRDGKPVQMTFEAFAETASKPGNTKIEERIHDPLVRIDNDLAVVWAPFDFLVDDKINHCGTDLFNLVRVDGQWLIASVTDTGTKSCSGHRT
jgi:hypothetical protein